MVQDMVKACKNDIDGNPIGNFSINPILDTYLYEYETGTSEKKANVSSEDS